MRKFLLFVFACVSLSAKAQDIDVLHYQFFVNLNDENDTLQAYSYIYFVPKTNARQIVFDLASSKNGKGMKVTKAMIPSQSTGFVHENDKLTIHRNNDGIGDTLLATIEYKGIPRDGLIIAKNKFGDRTFFADNWPNRAHHWLPCIDQPNDKASFEFNVQVPSHYQVISNGLKISETKADNTKTVRWSETIPSPTKVMVIGVAKFATKTYDNSPEGIPVSAWVYPKDSTKGFYDYALAPDILRFFSDYIAPFPYKKLANVQSKTIFGGMENASAIFYAESTVTGDRSSEDLLAHEIAHQWFGDAASEKSFAHLWLSEGFATFLTHYYWEKKYGKEAAAERWEKDRDEVIRFSKRSTSPVVDSTNNLMSLLNANSYQKGGWVLRMLRNEVGDSVFQKIIQTYYNQYKGGNAETKDFEAVAEKVSGKELSWFFDQWLYRPGIPQLQMSTKIQNNEFFFYISQKGKPYRFVLEVDIVKEDGEIVREQFEVSQQKHVFKVPVKGSSLRFSIDPEKKLLFESVD
ncbi:MAG TPA: M1 family metallopeptidase [Flavisolibacter sp.]|nr:M1 family metallopeptidase [Flavisolibacter sp.]